MAGVEGDLSPYGNSSNFFILIKQRSGLYFATLFFLDKKEVDQII